MTALKKTLLLAVFDPRSPGPMKIVVDTTSIQYLELRAVELIHEARQALEDEFVTEQEQRAKDYNDKMSKAIGLLGLAQTRRNIEAQGS